MDIDECKRKGFVKKARIDPELARSLSEMSDIKEKAIRNVNLDAENISAFVPMAYDSLREVLEAICIMHGYKVTSHVCIEKLLSTIYPDVSWQDFDRFRYIRNGINYYGKKVDFEQGKEIIDKIFLLKKEVSLLLGDLLGGV